MLHAEVSSASIRAAFYIGLLASHPSWAIHPGSSGSSTKFLTDGSWGTAPSLPFSQSAELRI